MKYEVTPRDVAEILRQADPPYSQGRAIIQEIWRTEPTAGIYRGDERLFARHVDRELARPRTRSEIRSLALIAGRQALEIVRMPKYEEDPIIGFFKMVRLELKDIPGRKYRRVKLRTLLRQLGYQRRSQKLVDTINLLLNTVRLQTYVRGGVVCDVGQVGLDETVMIRLQPARQAG